MTALTQDLTLTGEIVTVDGPLLVGKAYHLEDEIVVASGSVTLNYNDVVNGDRWRVRRGADDTTPATHASGTPFTLARLYEAGEAGAGGVTATDKQIVFMDGTDAVGSADLTWDNSAPTLGLLAADNDNSQAVISVLGAGSQLLIRPGAGDATHVGGELTLLTGVGNGNNSGAMTLETGIDNGAGDSGPINVETGDAAGGISGAVAIKTGDGTDTGGIRLEPGLASDGDAGGVDIVAGTSTNGTSGWASLASADGKQVYIDSTGIYLYGLPAADPGIANAIFTEGAPGAGAPVALKISGGPA